MDRGNPFGSQPHVSTTKSIASSVREAQKREAAMQQRVAVLGAGVAGLTAAHELNEAGFHVTVYEARPIVGGKARSMTATQKDGGSEGLIPGKLPAEHGFRFFPPFYRHLFDTMSRIPIGDGPNQLSVLDNLRPTDAVLVVREGKPGVRFPTHIWNRSSARSWRLRLLDRHFFSDNFLMDRTALNTLRHRLWTLAGASRERRYAEYEFQDWLTFVHGGSTATKDDQLVRTVKAMTRTLVAAHADEMSVRTGGTFFWPLNGRSSDGWEGIGRRC
jgi:uncharacterized protein with NAD-binding domain and iron-sulfur cluster